MFRRPLICFGLRFSVLASCRAARTVAAAGGKQLLSADRPHGEQGQRSNDQQDDQGGQIHVTPPPA